MTRRAALAALLVILLGACGGASTAEPRSGATAGEAPSGELTVFAAASLTEAFDAMTAAFGDLHPGVDIVLNHAGSQRLAAQIVEGAPADVFASASPEEMARLGAAGVALDAARVFARNTLAIAVEAGNPLGIASLDDLADDDVVTVLAAPAVPAGRYAAQALEDAGVTVAPASMELDVRGVVSKVRLGEADAGIAYRSDVAAAHGVEAAEIPDERNVVASYPIAALPEGPNPEAAAAFVAFVLSEEGRRILLDAGFMAAP